LVSADRLPLLRERDQVVLQEVWVDPRDLPRIPSQLCLAEVSGRVSGERRNAGLRPVLGEEDVRLGVEVVVQIGRPDYLFVYRREQERILLMERPPSEGDSRPAPSRGSGTPGPSTRRRELSSATREASSSFTRGGQAGFHLPTLASMSSCSLAKSSFLSFEVSTKRSSLQADVFFTLSLFPRKTNSRSQCECSP